MQLKIGYVYIMSNKNNTTLYIGVTNNLEKRVLEHKSGKGSVFTHKYNCTCLVYYESIQDMGQAIKREKQLKCWHRDWKDNLIREFNPEYKDLSEGWGYDDIVKGC